MANIKDFKQIQILPPFKCLCMTIGNLPTSYLESMTYYEMLQWFCKYLEETVIPTVDNNAEALTELKNYVQELKNYIDNYFKNLDVQEEINNKLDEMAESGELQTIITEVLKLSTLLCYDTVEELKNATNLVNGSFAKTLGFYEINDGGSAYYKITENDETANEINKIELQNNLMATLVIENYVNIKQFGAKGDNEHDDTLAIQTAINKTSELYFANGTYKITNTLLIDKEMTLNFNNTILSSENVEILLDIQATIKTKGILELNGNNSSFIGIALKGTRASSFDYLYVHHFKIWGIYSDPQYNNNYMNFNYIHTTNNGTAISTKGSYSANHTMIVNLTDEEQEIVLKDYLQNLYVVDNSNYKTNYNGNPIPYNRIWAIESIFTSSNQGMITTKGSSRNVVNTDYTNKDCYVLIGGGLGFCKTAGGVIEIKQLDSSNNTIAIEQNTAFGGHIGLLGSQSDYITLSCTDYCRNLAIGDFYAESSKTGIYAVSYMHLYCSILQLKLNQSEDSYFTSSQIVNIANGMQDTLVVKNIGQQYLQNRTLYHTSNSAITLTEFSQNNTVMKRNFQANTVAVNLDLKDIDLLYTYFNTKNIYVETTSLTNPMLFKLTDNLINNGFTIKNAVDNIFTVNQTSNNFMIIISLFNKQFNIAKIDL